MQKQIKRDCTEDQILWTQIIDGNKKALEIIFDMYGSELLTYGFRLCGNIALTKDAIQDVFVDIWLYRKKLSKEVQVKYYLYRCLRRALFKIMRTSALEPIDFTKIDNLAWIDSSPEMQWIEEESQSIQSKEIVDSINSLSSREREIISLKYYADMKIKEISAVLGIKEQTVANTLQNALIKLRKNLTHLHFLLFLIEL